MFQNLLGLQQTSDVPQLALIAEGSALIVFIFLSLNLFFKWKKNRRDATLNLFMSFLFYVFAVSVLFSTKSLDYFSGGEIDISTMGINLGYAFSIIGNIFLYYFTEDIFYDEETKIKYLKEVITFANGITVGFLFIFIFQVQSVPFLELPGEYIPAHLLIWHVLVSTVGFAILLVKAISAARRADNRLSRAGFSMIGLTALFEILVFVFFFLDRFSGGGYTTWYFIAWLSTSLAGLTGMIGYLMPSWFRRIFG
ncbi:MAG: hypothetical protein ACW99Q_05125 [Candidatus Kariarchaeaceae archaeon]|jgi:hypothetical protein